jgi:phosphatidylglycerol:prolipoprotein diacylglycerol transferase
MHPVLIDLFGFKIYSYGAVLVLSFILSTGLALQLGRKRGYSEDAVIELAMGAIVAGIIGCRIGYVFLERFSYYRAHPLMAFNLREGGMTITGGVVLAVLYVIYRFRRHTQKASVLNMLDWLGGPLLVGMAVGRFGCLLHGCCYGALTTLPWGITYPAGTFGVGVAAGPRQPSVMYEAAMDGLLLLYVLWKLPRERYAGEVFYSIAAGYGVIRFLDEMTRYNAPSLFYGPFSAYQWIAIAFFALGVAGLLGCFGRPPVDHDFMPREGERKLATPEDPL